MTKITRRRKPHYYATICRRGCVNEIEVHIFPNAKDRDTWVENNSGDERSYARSARKATAAKVRSILGYRGDAVTENNNIVVRH